MDKKSLLCPSECAGMRLDSFVSENSELSRSGAAKLIESGEITVNGTPVPKKYILKQDDLIEIAMPEAAECEIKPENIPLDIVYEDADIAIVNKPSGMVVHPAPGNYSGTLVNALLYRLGPSLSGVGGVLRPGIVHRIDKDTSGLLAVAKNDLAHRKLSLELERHEIVREYHLLCKGGFKSKTGRIAYPIGRHPVDRKRMAVLLSEGAHAKEAFTNYEIIEEFGAITYAKAVLETGRTHQIRVHFSYIGHPLIGDEVYGGGKIPFEKLHAPLIDGQVLHAKNLTLTHPTSGERMSFSTELPENFQKLLNILRSRRD